MTQCLFCAQIQDPEVAGFSINIHKRKLFETERFIVFPSLGQLVEGYLLIATREHFISMGAMPMAYFSELEGVMARVQGLLSAAYSPPVFFEHGPASETKRAGCCVDHAHIHAVPVSVDVRTTLDDHFSGNEIHDMSSLRYMHEGGRPYFFLQDGIGRWVYYVPSVVPSQYIRKVIAQELGAPEKWDWREHPELERIGRTLERLRVV